MKIRHATSECRVTTDGRKSPSFVVPVELISRLSLNLSALVKSDGDSTDNVLILEAVDADIFWRFFQFVFCGTYDSNGPIERDASRSLLEMPQRRDGSGGGRSSVASTGGGGVFGLSRSQVASTGGGGVFGFGPSRSPVDGTASNSLSKTGNTNESYQFCVSGGSGSLFGSGQSLPKSKQPYSLVSNTITSKISSGSQVPSKRKRVTPNDGENLGKHSETQQHCISLFLKKYKIDKDNFQVNAMATMPTIVSAFLSHCRMWHFACRYAIPTLMDYACSQLALELANFVIRATLFVPVFKRLVQYVYNECDTSDSTLRLLVAEFAACVLEDVSKLEGWKGLLTDVPTFKVDLGGALVHATETL